MGNTLPLASNHRVSGVIRSTVASVHEGLNRVSGPHWRRGSVDLAGLTRIESPATNSWLRATEGRCANTAIPRRRPHSTGKFGLRVVLASSPWSPSVERDCRNERCAHPDRDRIRRTQQQHQREAQRMMITLTKPIERKGWRSTSVTRRRKRRVCRRLLGLARNMRLRRV